MNKLGSEHNILFNGSEEGYFAAYRYYFGEAIESGSVKSTHLVDAYHAAAARFHDAG